MLKASFFLFFNADSGDEVQARPASIMYLYTIFNFKGKIKGQREQWGGWRGLILTLNDRSIKTERDYFGDQSAAKREGWV